MSQPQNGLKYCPECGLPNPGRARFCMDCGTPIVVTVHANSGRPAGQDSASNQRGFDWAAVATAFLAFATLRHLSRKGRQVAVLLVFLGLFFGCPLVCGTVSLFFQALAGLFQ